MFHHRDQIPLSFDLLQSPQQELAESHHRLDDAEDGFRSLLAQSIQPPALWCLEPWTHTRRRRATAVAEWRERMGAEEAKTIYKDRAATAECVNAQTRQRGLTQFWVRGLPKLKRVVLLFALAHNLMRMRALAPELVGIGTGTSSVPNLVT